MAKLRFRWTKIVVFLLCLAPAIDLGYRTYNTFHGVEPDLGVNPLEYLTHGTGDWTLRFLLLTLAITPLRKLLKMPKLIQFRRMLGLFAFFYGCCHLMTYLWFDKEFHFREILPDVAKRPFITAGFTALVLMLPLAVTSTTGWIRRMGGKKWQTLHRLVYVSGLAAVTHYWWLVKSDIRKPAMYAATFGVLMLYRLLAWTVPVLRARFAEPKLLTAETGD
jgi:sulfoxide reductase heme-binding subunit YedZ